MQIESTTNSSIVCWTHTEPNTKTATTIEETANAVMNTLREEGSFKFREGENGSYYFCTHKATTYNMTPSDYNHVISKVKSLLTSLEFPPIKSNAENYQGITPSLDGVIVTFHYDFSNQPSESDFICIARNAFKCLKHEKAIEFKYEDHCYRLDSPTAYAVHKVALKKDLLFVIDQIKNLAQFDQLQIKETYIPFEGIHAESGYTSYTIELKK